MVQKENPDPHAVHCSISAQTYMHINVTHTHTPRLFGRKGKGRKEEGNAEYECVKNNDMHVLKYSIKTISYVN